MPAPRRRIPPSNGGSKFTEKFRNKIHVVNKDATQTHVVTGVTTAKTVTVANEPVAPMPVPLPRSHLGDSPPKPPAPRKLPPPPAPEPQPQPKKPVQYKPYTLEQFKAINEPVQMGKLGYTETDDKVLARQQRAKVREYSQGVKAVNVAGERPPRDAKPIQQPPDQRRREAAHKRQKVKEFAAKVPKPRLKPIAPPPRAGGIGAPDGDDYLSNADCCADAVETELAILEAQHCADVEAVRLIRRELKF